ncbi:MAG: hypothetical protein ACYDCL_02845 [Myxococcales bacterium]
MTKKWTLWILLATLPATAALTQEAGTSMPGIEHTPVAKATAGQPLTLTATIRSSNGVFQPVVAFRHVGETAWAKVPLLPSGGDVYTATLPGATLASDIEYYLEAFDNDGNGPARAGSPDAPFRIEIGPAATAGVRQVTAQPASRGATSAPPAASTETSVGVSGALIGGIVSGAVGLVGLGIGVYGWVERNDEVNISNAANPAVRSQYQPDITQFTVVGAVGTAVGAVALGVGIWLTAVGILNGHASTTATDAPKDTSGGLSVAPTPGGAMASYSGRF